MHRVKPGVIELLRKRKERGRLFVTFADIEGNTDQLPPASAGGQKERTTKRALAQIERITRAGWRFFASLCFALNDRRWLLIQGSSGGKKAPLFYPPNSPLCIHNELSFRAKRRISLLKKDFSWTNFHFFIPPPPKSCKFSSSKSLEWNYLY